MRDDIQSLLNALQVTFFNQKIKYDIENPRALYRMAKENGFSGTIYKAIEDKIEDQSTLSRFRKDFYKYIADDEIKRDFISQLSDIFSKNSIDHIYLKGSHLKYLYPETYMRSMGDIDVLIKEEDMEKAEKCLIRSGFKLNSKGPVHDVFFFDDIDLELHRKLMIEEDEKSKILSNIWDYTVHLSNHQYQMSPDYELIYLLFHLRKHLLSSGVGLRNVVDIGVFLNEMKCDFNLEKLNTLLEDSNLTLFFKQMVVFNERYLNINLRKYYGISHDLDESIYIDFTEMIILSGVHGYGINHNHFDTRFAGSMNASTSIFKSILRYIFPSYNSLKYKYPKMLTYKIFLPLAWLRRIVGVVFLKTKRVFIILKLIRKSDLEEIKKIKKVLNDIGIESM